MSQAPSDPISSAMCTATPSETVVPDMDILADADAEGEDEDLAVYANLAGVDQDLQAAMDRDAYNLRAQEDMEHDARMLRVLEKKEKWMDDHTDTRNTRATTRGKAGTKAAYKTADAKAGAMMGGATAGPSKSAVKTGAADKGEGPAKDDQNDDHTETPVKSNTKRRELDTEGQRYDGNSVIEIGGGKKRREVTGVAKKPTKGMLIYNTEHYTLYNPKLLNVGEHVKHPHSQFSHYDSYTLVVNPFISNINYIPKRGVRLDDLTVAFAIKNCGVKQLSKNWQADFDKARMVRGLRLPLGLAAKTYQQVGDVDVNGEALVEGEQGWYYQWYCGLHELCGKEGIDGEIYLKRPANEEKVVNGFGFKKGRKAVVQLPPGHPDDKTMDEVDGYSKLIADLASAYAVKTGKPSSSKKPSDGGSGYGQNHAV